MSKSKKKDETKAQQGPQGKRGPVGPMGPPGPIGPKGDPGEPATGTGGSTGKSKPSVGTAFIENEIAKILNPVLHHMFLQHIENGKQSVNTQILKARLEEFAKTKGLSYSEFIENVIAFAAKIDKIF